MKDDMQAFKQGLEAGYALAIEDLRTALEDGRVSKKNREGVALLEALSFEAAGRWLEDSGEDEATTL